MSTQNFEGFQKLTEDQQKQVVGGKGYTIPQACIHIQSEIELLNSELAAIGVKNESYDMQEKISRLERKLHECELAHQ